LVFTNCEYVKTNGPEDDYDDKKIPIW